MHARVPRPSSSLGLVGLTLLAACASGSEAAPDAEPGAGPDARAVDAAPGAIDAMPIDAMPIDAVPIDAVPAVPVVFDVTGAIVSYQVPTGVTQLHVVADGASGGFAGAFDAGHGARVDTIVTVTPGESLSILVGDQPAALGALGDGCGGSGGGGSFVVRPPATALVVAGGGGGASAYGAWANIGGDASLTGDGASSGSIAGGTGGTGGGAVGHEGGGGGGLTGNGATGIGVGGTAFTGGGGGACDSTESCGSTSNGGFGGGGGGGNDFGGGGGGYSGGAGNAAEALGLTSGGGGSYTTGTATTIIVRPDHGPGRITITPM
ncbi:MAG: hypothetical protein H6708_30525 [Kofleriaceae bacterium]|nr:hypothetical protein [Kofleriaceae bacterium]